MKHVETVPKVLQNDPSVKFLINLNFEFLSQVFSAKCYTSLERAIQGLSDKLWMVNILGEIQKLSTMVYET